MQPRRLGDRAARHVDVLDDTVDIGEVGAPCAVDGVPTQMSETSASSTASPAEMVAWRLARPPALRDQLGQARLHDRAAART